MNIELRGERVVMRPIATEHGDELRAMLATPEVARWWGPEPPGFPLNDDPDVTRLTVFVDGEVAGLIQYSEEPEPEYRSASVDIALHPRFHGQGLGADSLRTLVRHLIDDRGHHRITIDPAAENAAAIRCYERVGFQPVGVMRRAWRDHVRDEWRDVLFMELVT